MNNNVSQKVSKKELTLWGSIWIAMLVFAISLMLIMSSQRADAAADKHVVYKHEAWSMIRTYAAPNAVGVGTHVESYTVTTATDYLFWPDGSDVNKIAPVTVQVCYHRNAGNGSLFQGVNSNPYFRDDTTVVNIGAIEVADDGTADNCNTQTIPIATRRWLRMDQSPLWFVTGKLRKKFSNDDDFDYKWGGVNYRYFHPGDDLNVGDWFYCECGYGSANSKIKR